MKAVSSIPKRRVVLFGAGRVGRGVAAPLFQRAGFDIAFVEADSGLAERLAAASSYRVVLAHPNGATRIETISGFKVIPTAEAEAVAEALLECDLAATAVGEAALQAVALAVTPGLERRISAGRPPLDVILCENSSPGADTSFRELAGQGLANGARDHARDNLGAVRAVVDHMVGTATLEEVVAEEYPELLVDRQGFRGEPPDIPGLRLVGNLEPYYWRKLFTGNTGHAALGYLGHLQGYQYATEALADPTVSSVLDNVLIESAAALRRKYQWPRAEIDHHLRLLRARYGNQLLRDTIPRLARQPIRKLGPEERLVGAARLVLDQGGNPAWLALIIAAALCYRDQADAEACRLAEELQTAGLERVLENVCKVSSTEKLGRMVAERYADLKIDLEHAVRRCVQEQK